jgi:small GTP-binding protein
MDMMTGDSFQNQGGNQYFDKDCPDFNWKLIIVGNPRVGKTSIMNRYVNDMFNDNEKSTKTVQISKKTVKIETYPDQNKWVQLHIWDTLGQEKFMALAPLFFRKAIGVFLVYDCTDRSSFEALDTWFQ